MYLPRPNDDSAAVILDYGADATQFHDGDLRVTLRGLELKTRWQFELGTELGLSIVLGHGPAAKKLKLQGHCGRLPSGPGMQRGHPLPAHAHLPRSAR